MMFAQDAKEEKQTSNTSAVKRAEERILDDKIRLRSERRGKKKKKEEDRAILEEG
jgi:hypothetical protein